MDDDRGMVAIVLLIVAVVFVGGLIAGSNTGKDLVAEEWCISLGYDTGEYDNGMDNVVCKHVEIMEGE